MLWILAYINLAVYGVYDLCAERMMIQAIITRMHQVPSLYLPFFVRQVCLKNDGYLQHPQKNDAAFSSFSPIKWPPKYIGGPSWKSFRIK